MYKYIYIYEYIDVLNSGILNLIKVSDFMNN